MSRAPSHPAARAPAPRRFLRRRGRRAGWPAALAATLLLGACSGSSQTAPTGILLRVAPHVLEPGRNLDRPGTLRVEVRRYDRQRDAYGSWETVLERTPVRELDLPLTFAFVPSDEEDPRGFWVKAVYDPVDDETVYAETANFDYAPGAWKEAWLVLEDSRTRYECGEDFTVVMDRCVPARRLVDTLPTPDEPFAKRCGPSACGASAALLWSRLFDGAETIARAEGFDQAGNLLAVVQFQDGLGFEGRRLADGTGAAVVSLSPTGRLRWVRLIRASGELLLGGRAYVDRAGSLVLVGSFSGTLDLDGSRYEAQGELDGFLVSWAPDGNQRFVRIYAARGRLELTDVAGWSFQGEASGWPLLIAGRLRGELPEGGRPGPLVSSSPKPMPIVFYQDVLGDWGGGRVVLSGPGEVDWPTIAWDANRSDVYIAGAYRGQLDVVGAGHTLVDQGGWAGYVVQLRSYDEAPRARVTLLDDGGGASVERLLTRPDGGVVAAGFLWGSVSPFGEPRVEAGERRRAYAVALTREMDVAWRLVTGGEGGQAAWSIAHDGRGGYLLGGAADGGGRAGGVSFTARSPDQAWLLGTDRNGEPRWSLLLDGLPEGFSAALQVTSGWQGQIGVGGLAGATLDGEGYARGGRAFLAVVGCACE